MKVLVDTSVLVAASLKCASLELKINLEDAFYKISKPLMNYFESNVDRRIGIVTSEIESSAHERIKKALLRNIEKTNITNKNMLEKMSLYSTLFAIINKELVKNLGFLVREPINQKAISKISYRVFNFYRVLLEKLQRRDPQRTIDGISYSAPKGFKGIMRKIAKNEEKDNMKSFRILKRKLENSPPDMNDVRLLSQAIYFVENKIFDKKNIMIASTDQHFCKVRVDGNLNTFIPEQIEKKFKIKCLWPDDALKELKLKKKTD